MQKQMVGIVIEKIDENGLIQGSLCESVAGIVIDADDNLKMQHCVNRYDFNLIMGNKNIYWVCTRASMEKVTEIGMALVDAGFKNVWFDMDGKLTEVKGS